MRDRSVPTGVPSTAQVAVRNNMRKDGAAWQALSVAQQQAWSAAAAKTLRKGKKSGRNYVPSGYQLFTALTTKWYQINGTGTPPVAPPTGNFNGDSISITCGSGTPGQLSFIASAANATGVRTELLVQALKGKNRKAMPKAYVSKGFTTYAAGSLTSNVTVPAGYWAVGYRFVETATGRETAIVPLPVTTVALSVEDGGLVEEAAPKAAKKAA